MSWTTRAWFLQTPGSPLECRDFDLGEPGPGQAIVQVLACGLCHTDLGYADGSVRPNHALPLILGHEVVGTVVAAGPDAQHRVGQPVIVPAVLPCGTCAFCLAGRGNACPKQTMPGNDDHGGFGTHLKVPVAPLVSLAGAPAGFDLRPLAVVADAVSTAWQAIRRAGVQAGDAVAVVGAGGVGGYTAQIAKALGAHVVTCDVSAQRLSQSRELGADLVIDVSDKPVKDVRKEVQGFASSVGAGTLNTKIFECSGTPAGQSLAFAFLGRGSTLVQVGFTPKTVELRLSNLMAFDATVHGTWGCPPEQYGPVLDLIWQGKVRLDIGLEFAGMSRINELLADMAAHRLQARMVLDPLR